MQGRSSQVEAEGSRTLVHAALIADGSGFLAAPGAMLIEENRILAVGSPPAIGEVGDARLLDLPGSGVIPALVNSHSHLDLTHIGPRPAGSSFTRWLSMIRDARAGSPALAGASVREGIRLARAGGTALIGDIAGMPSEAVRETLDEEDMPGICFFEILGAGSREGRAVERIRAYAKDHSRDSGGLRSGLQPHAPWSCGPGVLAEAAGTTFPLSMHCAETLEELVFADTGTGPVAEMLREFDAWDPSVMPPGRHPVLALEEVLSRSSWILAHLNYLGEEIDDVLDVLARTETTVAFCPRASRYFGHPVEGYPGHAWQAMIRHGIRVTVGTDSIVCLDTPERISPLDDIRLLFQQGGADPCTLLAMVTINGAEALGFNSDWWTLAAGPSAGLIAVDLQATRGVPGLGDLLMTRTAPRWILGPVPGRQIAAAIRKGPGGACDASGRGEKGDPGRIIHSSP